MTIHEFATGRRGRWRPARRRNGFGDGRHSGRFGPFAVGGALVLALATFVIFAGFTPIIPTPSVVLALLGGDGLIVVFLLALIVLELRSLRAARRAARAGGAAAQPGRRAVFAGGGDSRAGHRHRRDRFGGMGDQPAFMKDVGAFLGESGALSQDLSRDRSARRCCAKPN